MDEFKDFATSLIKLLKYRNYTLSKNPLSNIKILIPIEESTDNVEYLIPCIFLDLNNG